MTTNEDKAGGTDRMTIEEERRAFDAELEQNRVEVDNRRETVRAEHGQAISPERFRFYQNMLK